MRMLLPGCLRFVRNFDVFKENQSGENGQRPSLRTPACTSPTDALLNVRPNPVLKQAPSAAKTAVVPVSPRRPSSACEASNHAMVAKLASAGACEKELAGFMVRYGTDPKRCHSTDLIQLYNAALGGDAGSRRLLVEILSLAYNNEDVAQYGLNKFLELLKTVERSLTESPLPEHRALAVEILRSTLCATPCCRGHNNEVIKQVITADPTFFSTPVELSERLKTARLGIQCGIDDPSTAQVYVHLLEKIQREGRQHQATVINAIAALRATFDDVPQDSLGDLFYLAREVRDHADLPDHLRLAGEIVIRAMVKPGPNA
jgi:hypothetical protein